MPIAGSVISILGRPHSITGMDATGLLIITVEDITYNPGASHVDESRSEPAPGSGRKLQVKKRRRTALDAGPSFNNGSFTSSQILSISSNDVNLILRCKCKCRTNAIITIN